MRTGKVCYYPRLSLEQEVLRVANIAPENVQKLYGQIGMDIVNKKKNDR